MPDTEHRDNLPGDDAEILLPGETQPEMVRRVLNEEMPGILGREMSAILTRWADERARSREEAEDDREGASFGRDGNPD